MNLRSSEVFSDKGNIMGLQGECCATISRAQSRTRVATVSVVLTVGFSLQEQGGQSQND